MTMRRDIADLRTVFTSDGAEAVEAAVVAIHKRPFDAPCADPRTCGSEWGDGTDLVSGTLAVMCSRCGRGGTLNLAENEGDLS